nr:uncharacterized protein LOC107034728 [Vicugna pacos]
MGVRHRGSLESGRGATPLPFDNHQSVLCICTVIVFAASPPSPARTSVPSAPAEHLSAVRNVSSAKPRGDGVFLLLGLSAALIGSVALLEASSADFTGVFSVSARFVCLFPPAETRTPGFSPRHTLNGLPTSTNLARPVDLRTQNDVPLSLDGALPASCSRTSGVVSGGVRRGGGAGARRRHVPDRAAPAQPHPRQAVDREAPAAAARVRLGEAKHGPPPGDRGGEPLLAEPALPHGRAGVRPRRGPQGGRFRGHQGGAGGPVPGAQIRGGPARPPRRHQEVVLIASHRSRPRDAWEPAGGLWSRRRRERTVCGRGSGTPRSPPPRGSSRSCRFHFSPRYEESRRALVTEGARVCSKATGCVPAPVLPWEVLAGALWCNVSSFTFCQK